MLEPGQRIDRFEIVRLIGKGGMGEVYRARDEKLGRDVAIKVLPSEVAAVPERRQRFEREARAVAALQHPSIVTLHSIEEEDGILFLVMELVDGEPLTEAIPRGGLPLDRFLDLAAPLADAVAAAHDRGVTHRDLKPANVLLTSEGKLKVLDFGLAKFEPAGGAGAASIEPTEGLTGEGRVLGTVAYMSPEQVEGRPVDSRSDIFSLGVLFYEMATGTRPFDGDTGMSVLTAILRDEPVSVTERNQRLPRHLGRIVKRCLQKDPARRYQSALDLRNDLAELKEELDSGDLAAAGALPPKRPARPWLPLALGAALVIALAGWGLLGRGGAGAPAVEETPLQIRRLNVRGNPEALALSPDGRYVAYESEGAGGRSLRLQQIASGSDIELVPAGGWNVNFTDLAFSPDGAYVLYARNVAGNPKTLWEVAALGGSPRKLLDGILLGPALSPDGTRAAFVPGTEMTERWQTLVVAPLRGSGEATVLHALPADGGDFDEIAWSPDGDRIAVTISDGEGFHLGLLPSSGGEISLVPTGEFTTILSICWGSEATSLLVVAAAPSAFQLWELDIRSGERRPLVHDGHAYQGCGISADGRLTATIRTGMLARLWVLPLSSEAVARPVGTTSGRTDGASGIGWLDRDTLAYTAPTDGDWELWKVSAEGGESVKLTTTGADQVTAGRSGQIAFVSGWKTESQTGVYTIGIDGTGVRRLSPPERFAERPSVSPDGRWLFYRELTEAGMELLRRPFDGGEAVPLVPGNAHLVSYSPDGTRFNVHVRDSASGDWKTAIHPADFGPQLQTLEIHSETYSPWDTDRSLLISRTVDGVSNLWRVNIETGEEEQITFFTEERIFSFDVSPDFSRVALSRGEMINDLLVIAGL